MGRANTSYFMCKNPDYDSVFRDKDSSEEEESYVVCYARVRHVFTADTLERCLVWDPRSVLWAPIDIPCYFDHKLDPKNLLKFGLK